MATTQSVIKTVKWLIILFFIFVCGVYEQLKKSFKISKIFVCTPLKRTAIIQRLLLLSSSVEQTALAHIKAIHLFNLLLLLLLMVRVPVAHFDW